MKVFGINMDRNLESYIKVYDNWLEADKCKQTIVEMEDAQWQQHTFYNAQNGTYSTQSGNRELDVAYGNISTKKYVMQRIWDAYQRYLTDLNFPWFGSWKGFTEVRFNRYSEDRLMALHCDHIHSLFDGERKGIPTMTCLSILNEDYEGGELQIHLNDNPDVMKKEQGTVVAFPSPTLHEVTPVTKGKRYSLVGWITGKPFK